MHLYGHSLDKVRKHLWAASFTDEQTRKGIREVYDATGYVMDPHTAIGYLGVSKYRDTGNITFNGNSDTPFIILSTAHPAKFAEEIEEVLQRKVPIPQRLNACLNKEKRSTPMPANFRALKTYLAEHYG